MKKTSTYLLLTAALTFWATCALAGVSGSCANCHTMHATDGTGSAISGGAKGSLTIGGCVGCHTGTNAGGTTPYVLTSGLPVYGPEYSGGTINTATATTLAGGNFYWVDKNQGNDATKGHNVITDGLSDYDMDAPGRRDGDQPAFAAQATGLTCAGTMGCHGDRSVEGDYASVSGAHHGTGAIDGTNVAQSFRFLDGILGAEDSDWEFTVSNADHNGYKAEARTEASAMADGGNTISSLCGQCHGDFHSGTDLVSDGSAWLRHPTDIKLPGGEYASYTDGEGVGTYNVIAPVGASTPLTTDITLANSIVTCISCHRAHGSPYADLLRWDYDNISAGTMIGGKANNGCYACHTSKD